MTARRMVAILLSLFCAATVYGQDEPFPFDVEYFKIEYCKWFSILAKDVMTARQDEEPMSETLPYALDRLRAWPADVMALLIDDMEWEFTQEERAEMLADFEGFSEGFAEEMRPAITALVMSAYDSPAYPTERRRSGAINDFENDTFSTCYKEVEDVDLGLE